MPEFIDEQGGLTEDFRTALPTLLGDDYYNDPDKKQPTKYFENVKDLPTLLKRAVNADRTISRHGEALKKATEGMIKIPGENATPEEVAAYRKAHGVPDKPEGYQLAIPDNDKEGFEAIAKEVKTAAHEAGIPPSKLSVLWSKVINTLAAQNAALEKKGMELLAEDVKVLKEAKKEKYDAFIADTNKVAAYFNAKDSPIGTNFMSLMDKMGIQDTPVVREFLGAIAPLVLEGGSHIGAGGPKGEGGAGGFSYEYGPDGKPV